MKRIAPAIVASTLGVLLAAAVLGFWLTRPPQVELNLRLPGADRPAGMVDDDAADALAGGKLETFDVEPADWPGEWPRFRGANFDNVSTDPVPLARSWPATGPQVVWSIDVGEGHAAPAVRGGRVYLLDYDTDAQTDVLRCLSLADGRDIWRYSYPVKVKRNHGMSRTIPTVDGKYVVSIGPKCHVLCLDAETGERLWMLDLVGDFGATVPPWYAGQCPLIDDGRVILAVGSPEVLMMAVDCQSGEILWRTPNPDGWKMSHASIIPMQTDRGETYVYCAHGGVAGIAADDGELLWKTNQWKISIATVPSPVIIDAQRIFLSGGYNAGSMMLKLTGRGEAILPEETFRLKAKTFGAAQQTPILYRDHLYGVRPDGQLVCLDLSGKVLWASGSTERFGLGPLLIADGLIYVMNNSGLLTLAEATPAGFSKLAQAKVLDGHDAWGPMALAGGRLIVRDLTRMVCLDVRAR